MTAGLSTVQCDNEQSRKQRAEELTQRQQEERK